MSEEQDFHFTADIVFSARSLEDAMIRLAVHLLQYDLEDQEHFFTGTVEVKPVENKSG